MVMQKRHIIEEYEITPLTMVVMPITYGSKTYSKIIEFEEELISPFKPLEIIKKSCQFFGSSFEGRKDGTKELIGITHKVPISISPPNSIYFFPTTSPEKPQCIWISHEHIADYMKGSENGTIVTFNNGHVLDIPISPSSFQNQLIRTVMLKSKLTQRIEETHKKFKYMNKPRLLKASEMRSSY
ncbi:competence protein ComK [Cytobacillus sp. FJAT-54145]|uniref:Competence protein ComK n=1 Tax=Cytobacillus spartinae TaxID=3299023 RepID=A0ABW6K9K0_9BACI